MKASIIVPVRNGESTLERCLESIKAALPDSAELIVVDDASTDRTSGIAARFASRMERHLEHRGRAEARNTGVRLAAGEILIQIDADIYVRQGDLQKILAAFDQDPGLVAVTGLLSREHPHHDFFSQYKNLYMHYVFMECPEEIRFLYGSIHAVRRDECLPYRSDLLLTDDTDMGQRLFLAGKKIRLLKDLQVVHDRKHTLGSLIRNDFQVPFDWVRVFLDRGGLRQLGRGGTGFAHASKRQLAGIVTAAVTAVLLALRDGLWDWPFLFMALGLLWLLLHMRFARFLHRERGMVFTLLGLVWTWLDELVMAAGIGCGLIAQVLKPKHDADSEPRPEGTG